MIVGVEAQTWRHAENLAGNLNFPSASLSLLAPPPIPPPLPTASDFDFNIIGKPTHAAIYSEAYSMVRVFNTHEPILNVDRLTGTITGY